MLKIRDHLIFFMLLLLGACGCGEKGSSKKKSGTPKSTIERSFQLAASEHKIPMRLIMAAGFLESNLSPNRSSVPYFLADGEGEAKEVGFGLTETAFGIPRKVLGLPNDESADSLATQIEYYARWLRNEIDKSNIELDPSPNDSTQYFRWIWEMAKVHRNGEEQRRNIRIIWSKSLMAILNEGRVWQDPDSGGILELKPQPSTLHENDLPPDGRALLRLTDDIADISNARRFELTSESVNTLQNKPSRIEVIHCPLSLSACLELQDPTVESKVRLGAHYVIPQDNSIVPRALQIVDHERRVVMTSADGTLKSVKDAIVVMLVGNSGRYVEGIRYNADPTWFTPWQLRHLGAVITGVCKFLSQKDPNIDYRTCTTPEDPNGVIFHHQNTRPTYRWGDLPDYDKSIFWAYLRASDSNISGEAVFEFRKKTRSYRAGEEVKFFARFPPGVRWIRLQRAIRCDDKQIVWDTLRTDPVRTETVWPFEATIWDSGPNQNGHQFLRVLVYGDRNELTGWAIKDLFITGFDETFRPPSEACYFRDSQ